LRHAVGEDHSDTITAMGNLGDLYTSMARFAEAGTLLSAACASARRTLPRPHVVTGYTLSKHGRLLAATRRFAEAEASLVEAREILIAAAGADHPYTRKAEERLAELHEVWDGGR